MPTTEKQFLSTFSTISVPSMNRDSISIAMKQSSFSSFNDGVPNSLPSNYLI